MSTSTQEVEVFLNQLNHPLRQEIEKLREIIRSADAELTEHIKWNAPSFCHFSEDRITFNFPPKRLSIRLVFHRDAKSKIPPANNLIEDDWGLLVWPAKDRAVIEFRNTEEIELHRESIGKIVRRWIEAAKN